eukprot:1378342-Rhodomonas_salina.3
MSAPRDICHDHTIMARCIRSGQTPSSLPPSLVPAAFHRRHVRGQKKVSGSGVPHLNHREDMPE